MTTVNEVIVTGRVKRRLIDKAAKLWQRLSYWTKSSDVEFDDNKTAWYENQYPRYSYET